MPPKKYFNIGVAGQLIRFMQNILRCTSRLVNCLDRTKLLFYVILVQDMCILLTLLFLGAWVGDVACKLDLTSTHSFCFIHDFYYYYLLIR